MPAPQSTIDAARAWRASASSSAGFSRADEVADLLELAPRVGVELAVAREQVQILEQLDRHARRNVGIAARIDRLGHARNLRRLGHERGAQRSLAAAERAGLDRSDGDSELAAISVSVRPSP